MFSTLLPRATTRYTLSFVFLLFSQLSFAGRPMITDDATLLNKGQCQLEIWGERYDQEESTWFIPACNVQGAVEFALGLSHHRDKSEDQASEKIIVQAKTLFKRMERDGFGLGFIVGSEQPTSRENQADYYANIPFSWALNPDQPFTYMQT